MSNKRTASMAVIGNGTSPADNDVDDSMTDSGQHAAAPNGVNGSAPAATNSMPHVHDDKMDELVLSYLSKRGKYKLLISYERSPTVLTCANGALLVPRCSQMSNSSVPPGAMLTSRSILLAPR